MHATLTEVQRNALALEADDYASAPSTASTSRAPASSSTITQPAWQPVPPPAPTPAPTTLIATPRKAPAPIPQPQPSDLPLSASPFLRREKPLVSSTDGSALGGVQKSVLRALREGTSTSPFKAAPTAPETPDKGKSRAVAESPFASSASAFASPARDSFFANSPRSNNDFPSYSSPQPSSARKPTLSGFGSVRQQASAYGKARDESLTLFGPGGKLRYDEEMEVDDDEDEEEEEERRALPAPQAHDEQEEQQEEEEHTFGFRAAQDPAIAATIAAATPPSSKRRNAPSAATTTEKRRAVSTEPEDRRPTGSVKTGGGRATRASRISASATKGKAPQVLPGGFPGEGDAESDAGHDDEEDGEEEHQPASRSRRTRASGSGKAASTSKTATSTRRSARASSVQPPSTPQPKQRPSTAAASAKKSSAAGPETPKPTRRSSRLQTPAKEEAGGVGASARKTGTARKVGAGRRGVIEEEE